MRAPKLTDGSILADGQHRTSAGFDAPSKSNGGLHRTRRGRPITIAGTQGIIETASEFTDKLIHRPSDNTESSFILDQPRVVQSKGVSGRAGCCRIGRRRPLSVLLRYDWGAVKIRRICLCGSGDEINIWNCGGVVEAQSEQRGAGASLWQGVFECSRTGLFEWLWCCYLSDEQGWWSWTNRFGSSEWLEANTVL